MNLNSLSNGPRQNARGPLSSSQKRQKSKSLRRRLRQASKTLDLCFSRGAGLGPGPVIKEQTQPARPARRPAEQCGGLLSSLDGIAQNFLLWKHVLSPGATLLVKSCPWHETFAISLALAKRHIVDQQC